MTWRHGEVSHYSLNPYVPPDPMEPTFHQAWLLLAQELKQDTEKQEQKDGSGSSSSSSGALYYAFAAIYAIPVLQGGLPPRAPDFLLLAIGAVHIQVTMTTLLHPLPFPPLLLFPFSSFPSPPLPSSSSSHLSAPPLPSSPPHPQPSPPPPPPFPFSSFPSLPLNPLLIPSPFPAGQGFFLTLPLANTEPPRYSLSPPPLCCFDLRLGVCLLLQRGR